MPDRQAAILRVIQDWITEPGEVPTVREIGARVDLPSTASVFYNLARLESRGLISRTGHR
ncbi:winged helix DNA-binding protein [Streptomyces sp. NPDC005899]|uniref:LexA family protein n=1 Tax=Streptomyces sp. NPDC005899 TaxID=3155716 RepID=UPI0033F16083